MTKLLGKLECDVLLSGEGDTTKIRTAERLSEKGMIKITFRYQSRRGLPCRGKGDAKPGEMIISFDVTEKGRQAIEILRATVRS